jgi:hypothetical protein
VSTGGFGDAGRRPKQEDFFPELGANATALGHQVHTGDALLERLTLQARQPDQGHAIRDRQVRFIEGCLKLGLAIGNAQEIEVDCHNLVRSTGSNETSNTLSRARQVDLVEEDATKLDAASVRLHRFRSRHFVYQ